MLPIQCLSNSLQAHLPLVYCRSWLSLCSAGVTCPICPLSQLLVHPYPAHWSRRMKRSALISVWKLLSRNGNIFLLLLSDCRKRIKIFTKDHIVKMNSIIHFLTLGRRKGSLKKIFFFVLFTILSSPEFFICADFCDILFFGQGKSLNRIKWW